MLRIETKERGSVVIIAMLAMVALISLGGLSTLVVRGGIASSGHDRFRSIALYAAESGVAAASDYLRGRVELTDGWSSFVNVNNNPPFTTNEIPGNGKKDGEPGNLFSPDLKAWYEVVILNNLDDNPGFAAGNDTDHRVIIRSTGHGPAGTIARIEVEIHAGGVIGGQAPPCAYSQESQCADNAGFDPGSTTLTGPSNRAAITPGN